MIDDYKEHASLAVAFQAIIVSLSQKSKHLPTLKKDRTALIVRCVRWGYEVLSYGRNMKVILEAPLHDKDCVLGNILAAHYLSSCDPSKVNLYVKSASSKLERSTPYEKAVFETVTYLISEDKDDDLAFEMHIELLKRFPKDLVYLKRAQVLSFQMAKPVPFLNLVQQVLPANQDESYIHGMLAFPLLELGRMEEAAAASRKGYGINKEDALAHHCFCHVLQHKCHFKEAVECTHNWWHVALCYLEGGSPMSKVKEIYDNHIWKELEKEDAIPPEVYLNALGLFLRLDVRDVLDGFKDRLELLAARLTDQFRKAVCLPPSGFTLNILPWICWVLWTSRNALVFEDKRSNPEDIALKGLRLAKDWMEAQGKTSESKIPPKPKESKDRPPDSSENPPPIVCATDAAWNASRKTAGLGWTFSGPSLTATTQGSRIQASVNSPLIAEALAVRTALYMALTLDFTNLKVCSDNSTLIRAITSKSQSKEIIGIVSDIQVISSEFTSISFSFIPRSENSVADGVAKADWQLDILIVWALAKVGETSMAHELLEGLKFRLSKMNKKKQQVMQKAIQLGEAVYEYAKGNYKQALCLLGSDFNAIDYKATKMFGTALLMCAAKEVIRKRIKVREGSPFTWCLLEKSYAMEGDAEALNAGQRAKMLESSYF
ncbi:hypothetical protein IGI04_030311 [Brassica rapa subsp. trilocularis]|uniref:RNase H type-1 domain-containing protein n=1 Tax=Brassica rapa subsp. trilocularis TaxID=1813537 RepID=A0ABQ7LQC0_BRACM|nr:hypothetical protein IGI04_030311 [Brassica rapa subsp. trilocularis]